MTCKEIESWSFSGLVGAFLDLAIAYLLLCGSTFAYFASRFLGFFGLCLPCPCNGLFGNPNGNSNNNICLQRHLVDCPPEKISSVQFSVKSKFPFDSVLAKEMNPQLMSNLVNETSCENGVFGFEGEASCSSFSGKRSRVVGNVANEGRFEVNGKGGVSQRYGLRRRQKSAVGHGKFSLVSSHDALQSDTWAVPQSPVSVSRTENIINERSRIAVNSEDGRKASMDASLSKRVSYGKLNESADESKAMENDASPVEEFKCNAQPELGFDGNEQNTIRVLEQALEEEHAARSALYLELEKERSAAATAADETMAMILRLQEEKASVEMEKKQYQRMIEEKSAYDAEEMNILKEILVRREREKHFLEKEVEAYRQMFFGNEQLGADMRDMVATDGQRASSLYSSEDLVLMLHRISESFGDKEKVKNVNNSSQNRTLAFGKELPIPELDEDADSSKLGDIHSHPSFDRHHPHLSRSNDEVNEDFNEKGVVSMGDNPVDQEREVQRLEECTQFNLLTSCQGLNVHDKTTIPVGGEKEQGDGTSWCQGLTSKSTETLDKTKIIVPYNDDDIEKQGKDSRSSVIGIDPCVHDVHVIDDESKMSNELSGNKSEHLSVNPTLNIPRTCDSPTMGSLETELDINRSSSDFTNGLPPMGFSRRKALLVDTRRNSMSAVDYERLKIDNEVGWLRERLRVVQEGREKLNLSAGHREREKVQLQLLEDIASQLREIRQLTEPGKAERQVSLPPPSSKVMLKKRRWRSVSFGVHRST